MSQQHRTYRISRVRFENCYEVLRVYASKYKYNITELEGSVSGTAVPLPLLVTPNSKSLCTNPTFLGMMSYPIIPDLLPCVVVPSHPQVRSLFFSFSYRYINVSVSIETRIWSRLSTNTNKKIYRKSFKNLQNLTVRFGSCRALLQSLRVRFWTLLWHRPG